MFVDIFIFLLVLSLLILVHELGHFYMARRAGVWVEEFGFGLPPRVWGKKVGETIFSINLLPFGGFVRLHGEDPDAKITKPKKSFGGKNKKTRTSIIIAGVVMNFLLAIVAFAAVYSFSGIPRETNMVKVLDVASESPAQVSGILVGDIVEDVEGKEVTSTKQFIEFVEENKGSKVSLNVLRDEEVKKISLTPRVDPPEGEGALGVTISSSELYYPPFWQRPFFGIYHGFGQALFWGKTVVVGLFNIFTDLFRGSAPKDLAGPVGIFALTSEAATLGVLALVNFVGILSVNLAVLNILPFPALDGGRLLFIGIEKMVGKKVLPKVESTIHTVGMIILLILIFAITASDIKKIVAAGGISNFIDSVLR